MTAIWERLIQNGKPAVVLAPMEGVTDAPMRAFITAIGGIDFCVSEFIRVSQDVLPEKSFTNDIPELRAGSVTPSGVKIVTQILGGNPERMLGSALNALKAGARAIDLNFGCPSQTVNGNDGGASLLKHPHRIRDIVRTLREGLPAEVSVSAKLRLGWESIEDIHRNAQAAAEGGADWITIHARTRMQSYNPPVFWKKIGEVRRELAGLPVIANGDIWTLQDFRRAREETGCEHFMLGRGVMADPYLPLAVQSELRMGKSPASELSKLPVAMTPAGAWRELAEKFAVYAEPFSRGSEYTACRMKQWLRFAEKRGNLVGFEQIKKMQTVPEILNFLS